jgi:hypothetical protein
MPRTDPDLHSEIHTDHRGATYAPGFTARGMRRPTSTWTEYSPPARRVVTPLPGVVFAERMAEDYGELIRRLYGAA